MLTLGCVHRVSWAFNLQKPLLIEQQECIPLRIHAQKRWKHGNPFLGLGMSYKSEWSHNSQFAGVCPMTQLPWERHSAVVMVHTATTAFADSVINNLNNYSIYLKASRLITYRSPSLPAPGSRHPSRGIDKSVNILSVPHGANILRYCTSALAGKYARREWQHSV